MTMIDLEDLYTRYVENIQQACGITQHMGGERDGGYHECDKYIVKNNCLGYSFGSRRMFEFEDDVTQTYGCEVHTFDPFDVQKDHQHSPKVTFHKLGIGKEDGALLTLGTIKKKLKHSDRVLDILKIDIEKAEWDSLAEITASGELSMIKTLIVEFHLCIGPVCRDTAFRILLVVCLAFTDQAWGYAHFRYEIPNGDKVPHPCNPNLIWEGVGHLSKGGGGPRNPFGLAFYGNGQKWDRTLCEADSDGDGKSNGAELGDPACIWTPNSVPSRVTGLSHPGICDPLNSPACKGKPDLVNCTTAEFKCALMEETGVFNHVVRIPETPVPKKQTTYECMAVGFPSDAAYHLVAYTPHIDNINVMHHAILYGCRDGVTFDEDKLNKPYDCFMGERSGCNDFVMLWALGIDGYCFNQQAGMPIGINGYKYAILELHWNNPEEIDSYTDSSGLNLYLTKNLRPFNAAVLMIGDTDLEIPPLEQRHSVHGSCSAKCTQQYMTGPIKIFTAFNHMHYLGAGAETLLVDANKKVNTLALDVEYSYDRPVLHTFDDTITLNPGDELQTTCHFRSMTKSRTTFYGEGTSDEMCYSFLIYYPAENMKTHRCVSHSIYQECDNQYGTVNGCNFLKAYDLTNPVVVSRFENLTTNCAWHTCLKECKQVVRTINEDPCFSGENRRALKQITYRYLDSPEVYTFWTLLESCEREIEAEKCSSNGQEKTTNEATRQAESLVFGIFVMIGLFYGMNIMQ